MPKKGQFKNVIFLQVLESCLFSSLYKLRHLHLIFITLILATTCLFSQKKSASNSKSRILTEENKIDFDQFYQPIHFHNIGEVQYFYKKKDLKKINKHQKKNKTKKLIAELEKYVSQFDPRNGIEFVKPNKYEIKIYTKI